MVKAADLNSSLVKLDFDPLAVETDRSEVAAEKVDSKRGQ